jgi:glutathione peroxidase-family protein
MGRRTLILFCMVAALTACQSRNSITIKGTLGKPAGEYVKLWRVDVNVSNLIDSAKIKSNGSFSLKLEAGSPEFYQLGYSQSDFITLLGFPGEKISLSFSDSLMQKSYTVTGSEESEMIREIEMKLADTKHRLDSLRAIYDAEYEDPSLISEPGKTEQAIYNVVMDQRKYSLRFVLENLNSLASIKAVYQKLNDEAYVLFDHRDLQVMKILTDTLTVKYPDSKQVKAMAEDISRELSNIQLSQLQALTESIEPTTLNPDLVSINGQRVSLSSLKGKYVLLTFWSADSRECITSNMQLKTLYSQYRRKGFEIYQINLDSEEQKWRDAVNFDELPWISVREDNPLKPLFASLYNVQTLPTNYLYSREGEIIASNLHGRALAIKLEQIFGL